MPFGLKQDFIGTLYFQMVGETHINALIRQVSKNERVSLFMINTNND